MTTIGITNPSTNVRFGAKLDPNSQQYLKYASEFDLPLDTFIAVPKTPRERSDDYGQLVEEKELYKGKPTAMILTKNFLEENRDQNFEVVTACRVETKYNDDGDECVIIHPKD